MAIQFPVPLSTIQLHEKWVADFIAQLGKSCTLFYPFLMVSCPNCIGGFQYLTGGPYPFTTGSPCPYCNGTNHIQTEPNPDVITMLIYDDPRDFILYGEFKVAIPAGAIQTRGLMSDLNKVQRCNRMVRNSIDGIQTMSYTKAGEATPMGFRQTEEFVQSWTRGAP